MAKVIIEKFRCDRCGNLADKRPDLPIRYRMVVSVDYGMAGGKCAEWLDCCERCNSAIERIIADAKPEETANE